MVVFREDTRGHLGDSLPKNQVHTLLSLGATLLYPLSLTFSVLFRQTNHSSVPSTSGSDFLAGHIQGNKNR